MWVTDCSAASTWKTFRKNVSVLVHRPLPLRTKKFSRVKQLVLACVSLVHYLTPEDPAADPHTHTRSTTPAPDERSSERMATELWSWQVGSSADLGTLLFARAYDMLCVVGARMARKRSHISATA